MDATFSLKCWWNLKFFGRKIFLSIQIDQFLFYEKKKKRVRRRGDTFEASYYILIITKIIIYKARQIKGNKRGVRAREML